MRYPRPATAIEIARTFDLDYRLTRIQGTGSAAMQDLTLGYDGADNISSITDWVTPSLGQTFQYDLLGRVTQGVAPYGHRQLHL
jgi:YD repeat-containing protein